MTIPIGHNVLADKFQVAAFGVHYKIARRAGDGYLEAFVKAIVQTSDEETAAALERDSNCITQWYETADRFKKYRD